MSNYCDVVAERAVLSILLNYPSTYVQVADMMQAPDFTTSTHQMILHSVQSLIEENPKYMDGIDVMALRSKAITLGYSNFNELTANGSYVEALFVQKFSPTSLLSHLRIVKELSVRRSISKTVHSINEIAESQDKTSVQILTEMEGLVTTTANSLTSKSEIEVLGNGFMEWANEAADAPRDMMGISTGYPRFDKAIGGGLRRGAIAFVGARPKNFKSGFGLNIAKNVAVHINIPVLILDTELRKVYQRSRFGACIARVPVEELETGRWRSNPHFVAAVETAAESMEAAPLFHVYVGGNPIEKTLSIIRFWLSRYVGRNEQGRYNDCVIVYDYIKLMDAKEVKAAAEWQVLGFQMTALHDLVTKYDVPMLVFGQLNREGGIAAADRILWFCSNASIIGHKEKEEKERDGPKAGNMKIYTFLSRYGPAMDEDDYLNLRVDFPIMSLEEGKMKSELCPPEPAEKPKKSWKKVKGQVDIDDNDDNDEADGD